MKGLRVADLELAGESRKPIIRGILIAFENIFSRKDREHHEFSHPNYGGRNYNVNLGNTGNMRV